MWKSTEHEQAMRAAKHLLVLATRLNKRMNSNAPPEGILNVLDEITNEVLELKLAAEFA